MNEFTEVDGADVAKEPGHWLLIFRFLISATCEAAWMAIKNLVKPFLGRERCFDERGLFLRQYLLHVTRVRRIRTITCVASPMEGPGAQAVSVMNAINFARYTGLTYAHTPFKAIQHADRPMKEWAEAWETLFNLGAGELACETKTHELVNHWYNMSALELCFGGSLGHEKLIQHFKFTVPEFRRKYYLDKSRLTTQEVTIAVHARRGWDVSPIVNPFSSIESILRIIGTAKAVLDARNIQNRISVYSEGNQADFDEFFIPGVRLSKYRVGHYSNGKEAELRQEPFSRENPFEDIDAISAMKELIEADILIMSKSSFCSYAGLISDGIKFFANDGKDGPPLENWILFSRDGSFDRKIFDRQLSALMLMKKNVDAQEETGN